jgi:YgiT-type zinc finger domain-containing protein
MRCRVCGALLERRVADLPFRIGDFSIVIVKALPVLQCMQCGETELEHPTMLRVDQLLARVNRSTELEVIQFAA